MNTFDPIALACLAAIIEEGSFDLAAQRLSITQSAVSQRLRSLETQVGTVLLVRSRPLKATPAGQLLLKHAKMLRLLGADLNAELQALAPSQSIDLKHQERISVAINADSIATWALPALGPLVSAGLPLEIIADDQEFTHEWLSNGEVLGCVTSLPQALRGCTIEPLGQMHYTAVACPRFAAERLPHGLDAHHFMDLPFIAFNRKDHLQAAFVKARFGLSRVLLQQRFVPSCEAQVSAVLAGWGVSVLPDIKVRPLLEQGLLIDLAPGHRLSVTLYWHCWRLQSAVLQALTKALRLGAQQHLAPVGAAYDIELIGKNQNT